MSVECVQEAAPAAAPRLSFGDSEEKQALIQAMAQLHERAEALEKENK